MVQADLVSPALPLQAKLIAYLLLIWTRKEPVWSISCAEKHSLYFRRRANVSFQGRLVEAPPSLFILAHQKYAYFGRLRLTECKSVIPSTFSMIHSGSLSERWAHFSSPSMLEAPSCPLLSPLTVTHLIYKRPSSPLPRLPCRIYRCRPRETELN